MYIYTFDYSMAKYFCKYWFEKDYLEITEHSCLKISKKAENGILRK